MVVLKLINLIFNRQCKLVEIKSIRKSRSYARSGYYHYIVVNNTQYVFREFII